MDLTKKKIGVNILLFIDFMVLAVSGFVMKVFLPAYQHSGEKIWIFPRVMWLEIHDVSAIIFVILILVHLILSWNWIKMCVFRIGERKR